MEHDSPTWRQARDALLEEWIPDAEARRWLLAFGEVCEVFDDLVDRDKPVPDERIYATMFRVLVEMPLNPFFDQWRENLLPVVILGINAWIDANRYEQREPMKENEMVMAYSLRNWYAEIVHLIIYLTRGRDVMLNLSPEIRGFFSAPEDYPSYRAKLMERAKHGEYRGE